MVHLTLCLRKQDMSKFERYPFNALSLTSDQQVKERYILLK